MPKLYIDTRGIILKAAQEEIEEKGLERVNVRSIAQRAGLGLGTFYNYFKSRRDLISYFLTQDRQAYEERLLRTAKEVKGDVYLLLKDISESVREFYSKHQDVLDSFHKEEGKEFCASYQDEVVNSIAKIILSIPKVSCTEDEALFYAYSIFGYSLGEVRLPLTGFCKIINRGLFRLGGRKKWND